MTAKSKAVRRRGAKRELAAADGKRPTQRARGGTFKHVETVARSLTTAGRRRARNVVKSVVDTVSKAIVPRAEKLWRGLANKRRRILTPRASAGSSKT